MRRRAPLAEGAGDAGGQRDAESLADLAIERVVLAEPDVARDARCGCAESAPGCGANQKSRIGGEAEAASMRSPNAVAYHTDFPRVAHPVVAPLGRAHSLQTSRRDIFLLACCQALLLTNASGLISMNGLVGFSLARDEDARDVRRHHLRARLRARDDADVAVDGPGRPPAGFMAGATINIAGCLDRRVRAAVPGASRCSASPPAIIGVYNAVGLQYRFAAAEVAAPDDRAKAISLVLAGGVVGGLIGPQATRFTRDLFATPFQGSFVMLVGIRAGRARGPVAGARAASHRWTNARAKDAR